MADFKKLAQELREAGHKPLYEGEILALSAVIEALENVLSALETKE